ncbi:hypothetical protein FXO38_01441 [Capsicum annuum]|nr:hypothetical protein FXO38_01441 [Capsicum annuum]KAF3684451.1 hypothetical protein FXO37_01326 [Capsicum annuum]
MTNKYQKYNALMKWLDRNCDIALDCPVRCRDLKNVLKAHFKVYLDWDNDIAVPSIPDTDSDSDEIFIRNLREVCTRGRPQINTNKSSCQNAFCRDGRRWGSKYYDVYNKGQSSQGRSGDGRRGRRESR